MNYSEDQILNYIQTYLTNKSGRINSRISDQIWWEKRNLQWLQSAIVDLTHFLDDSSTFGCRIYCIKNGIVQHPNCIQCGSKTNWQSSTFSFSQWCSVKCATNDERIKTKIESTNKQRYGVSNYSKTSEFRNKLESSSMSKYGVSNPSKSNEVKKKIRKTFNQKYKNGHPKRDPKVQEKIRKNSLEKYGVEHPAYRNLNPEIVEKINDPKWLQEEHQTKSQKEMALDLGVTQNTIFNHFKKYSIQTIRHGTSIFEKEVLSEVLNYIDETLVVKNSRSIIESEIDIFAPTINLAIECNGTYWHTEENGRGKFYHQTKSKKCYDLGIRLIHVWEHTWKENKEIYQLAIKESFEKCSRPNGNICDWSIEDPFVYNDRSLKEITKPMPYETPYGTIWDSGLLVFETK